MSDVAIRVEGLSKLYRLGEREKSYKTLRDTISDLALGPFKSAKKAFRKNKQVEEADDETLWALNDVSFEIKRGEVVGIIGRNGAGKSTLLKVLSRITEPNKGFAEIHGRVGSLLEVGTGFHPELSGRDNVFMNGAILGMRREEIRHKFDEIVAFAEVEKFIDTAVKHYSSGMYLRLAFAVAAHLEPEILLIDEVLAVGDAQFQRKCLGKMEDVAANGRTVLFVSHNLSVVKELCTSSVVLRHGKLDFRGSVVDGLSAYSQQIMKHESSTNVRGTGWGALEIDGVGNGIATTIEGGQPLLIEADLDIADPITGAYLFCLVNDGVGDTLMHQRIKLDELGMTTVAAGRYHVRVEFPPLWLGPGMYAVSCKLFAQTLAGDGVRCMSDVAMLDVVGKTETLGKGRVILNPPAQWSVDRASAAVESTAQAAGK